MMAGVIPTFNPGIQVLLKKTAPRRNMAGGDARGKAVASSNRFQSSARTIDLTPYLGEGGSVRTSKAVRAPAGAFSIVLADKSLVQAGQGQFESAYGLIEPMDVVEIRMARTPNQGEYQAMPGKMPIVMRGFVSSVRRSEAMGEDGKPRRTIIISGQDYGKILQIMQVIYRTNYVLGETALTAFKLFEKYGVGFEPNMPTSKFVIDVLEKVINQGFLAKMQARAGKDSPVQFIQPDATVKLGTVSPFGINAWDGGAIYSLLTYHGDVGPWNELFTEDREDGVFLVYRPAPLKDPAGTLIQVEEGAKDPGTITVDDDEVKTHDVTRSDAGVANYYWVDSPRFILNDMATLKLLALHGAAPQDLHTFDYRNTLIDVFGIRQMEYQTQQVDDSESTRTDMQKAAKHEESGRKAYTWIKRRRDTLIRMNRDNLVFESGMLKLRGNERIKAGMNLKVRRGKLSPTAYLTQVDHEFIPFRRFETTVYIERGTGFIERAGAAMPYLDELDVEGAY